MENNEKDVFDALRNSIKKQLKEAYLEGANQGAITTCATLYHILQKAGITEPNIFYDIVKDIAKRHGCEDLAAATAQIEEKVTETKTEEEESLPRS